MTQYFVHARTRDEMSGDRYPVTADTRDTAIAAYQAQYGDTALPVFRVTTAADDTPPTDD